ncbi:undecaprenyl-diphosphate phosphatase [Candidatus Saccharibacteria bacterium]|nr:undecaprenyl-diphosphate phosphatase [Candidatus Saccharibacteria bacterium]MCB9821242.1 undecaprenyl-diphosphate phosphatase [Candidatus Nomurabacteria bacterium]
MSIYVAIILGIVQGITEFIPISSSGHLAIIGSFFDLGNHFTFDVLLNLGTLTALVWYTRLQLLSLVRDFLRGKYSIVIKLIIATIPAVLAGFLFSDFFENLNTNIWIVVTMLLVIGILMITVKQKTSALKSLNDISLKTALIIGLAQTLALIPGTSRSGVTILAGLFIGLGSGLAAEWSFLMAVPIVAGASLKTLASIDGVQFVADNFWQVLVGNVASFVVGLLAIDYMMKLLKHQNLRTFGLYRLCLGAILVCLLIFGKI